MHHVSGWLNINKPAGVTSFFITNNIKRILKTKTGHGGTLDPFASGVLPIALGEASKLIEILMSYPKTYVFTMKFGMATDSGDLTGTVIDRADYIPSSEECNDITSKFLGEISQTPPKFSALKVNGRRAYTLARNNIDFTIQPRKIFIYNLKLINYDFSLQSATYEVVCSTGTYIRTLAEDIAKSLKTLGFVIELARTKVGPFDIASSVSFEEPYGTYTQDLLKMKVQPIKTVLDDIPVIEVDEIQAKKIRFGQMIYLGHHPNKELIWVSNRASVVAIGQMKEGYFCIKKVLNDF